MGVLELDVDALPSIENLLNAFELAVVGAAFPKERFIELKMDGFGSLNSLSTSLVSALSILLNCTLFSTSLG